MIVADRATDRRRLVRRNTLFLIVAQGFVQTAFPVVLVVGSVAVAELSGRESATGFLYALYFGAAATGGLLVGRWMDRVGRRPGLVAGYLLVGGAGLMAAASVAAGSSIGLLAAAVPFGLGLGAANLARGAVADMYPPASRGRAVGLLLAASTVGAVGSPQLVALLRRLADGPLGVDPNVLPWALVPVAAAVALACALSLRPDPRDLADRTAEPPTDAGARQPRELLRLRAFRAAVVAASIGQMAMIAVMGVTPLALHHHGESAAAISGVISLHIAGMYAFSPLIGAALDRWGRRPGLLVGAATSGIGALIAGTQQGALPVGSGLFLIGLGWSATYLGATAVISDLTTPAERSGALGFNDLLISGCSAAGGLAAGLVYEGAGYRTLGVGVALVVGLVLLTLLGLPESRPSPVPAVSDPGGRGR